MRSSVANPTDYGDMLIELAYPPRYANESHYCQHISNNLNPISRYARAILERFQIQYP